MKNLLHIAAVLDKPEQLKNIVEKLAFKRVEGAIDHSVLGGEWQPVKTSSVEAYASGVVSVGEGKDQADMPFITSFLFTCIQLKKRAAPSNGAAPCLNLAENHKRFCHPDRLLRLSTRILLTIFFALPSSSSLVYP